MKRKQLQVASFFVGPYEARPITKKDKWCKKRDLKWQKSIDEKYPWGYIVILDNIPQKSAKLFGLRGTIIRSKKRKGQLLLQVIPWENTWERPEYTVGIENKKNERGIKKKVITIVNLLKN